MPTVTKLDRLARSVGDLLATVARLDAKKDSLKVLSMSGNQPLDTSTSTGRLMLAVIAAVGQAERDHAGTSARGYRQGEAGGALQRPCAHCPAKSQGIRPSEIAVRLGIGRASVHRVLGEQ